MIDSPGELLHMKECNYLVSYGIRIRIFNKDQISSGEGKRKG